PVHVRQVRTPFVREALSGRRLRSLGGFHGRLRETRAAGSGQGFHPVFPPATDQSTARKEESLGLGMGDFLLDFRGVELRRPSAAQAASLLKFCDDTWVQTLERESFSLVLTRVDEPELWAPFEHRSPQGNVLVALT